MKILYLHYTDIDSKPANLTQAISMCNAFAGIGIELVLALPFSSNKEAQISSLYETYSIDPGIVIDSLPVDYKSGPLKKFRVHKLIDSLIRKYTPDYVFIRTSNFIPLLRRKDFKIIYENHGIHLHSRSKLAHKFYENQLIKYSYSKQSKAIIYISEALKDHWSSKGVNSRNAIALHDGFGLDEFSKIHDQKNLKKELGLSVERKMVLYTGKVTPEREIENLIELAKRNTGADFYIAGSGNSSYRQKLEYQASKDSISNIYFLGLIPHKEIHKYIFAADLLLALWSDQVKTINHCSPLKLFEYLASGRPIVCHDYPSIREVVEDQKHLYLVKPGDMELLQAKVQDVLNDKYPDYLPLNARQHALENFSWNKRAGKILSFLESEQER